MLVSTTSFMEQTVAPLESTRNGGRAGRPGATRGPSPSSETRGSALVMAPTPPMPIWLYVLSPTHTREPLVARKHVVSPPAAMVTTVAQAGGV